jgi:hypothetical protein
MRVLTTDDTTASLAAGATVDKGVSASSPATAELRAVRVTSDAPAGTTGTATAAVGYDVNGAWVPFATVTTGGATAAIDATFTDLQMPADDDSPAVVRVTNGTNAPIPNVRVVTVATDTVNSIR